jgi:hypothetical protein
MGVPFLEKTVNCGITLMHEIQTLQEKVGTLYKK